MEALENKLGYRRIIMGLIAGLVKLLENDHVKDSNSLRKEFKQ
jgi:hypothetical protein